MRILASPLDWGLGHASRLSCLIARLKGQGHEIVMAGSGASLELLRNDFPELRSVELKSFSPWFFRRLPQWIAISLQVPHFIYCCIREYISLRRLISKEHFDLIISDNRYGLHSQSCRSVIVTHQLTPHIASWCPAFVERLFARCLKRLIDPFDEIWIPDDKPYPDGLSGDLSRTDAYDREKIKYVGILSRLDAEADGWDRGIDYLAIISGPEPMRSHFERHIIDIFESLEGTRVIVRGLPGEGADKTRSDSNGIIYYNHCSNDVLSKVVASATSIICHSGYSTILDLVHMRKRAYLIATVGQAEQEYLAKHCEMFSFVNISSKYQNKYATLQLLSRNTHCAISEQNRTC